MSFRHLAHLLLAFVAGSAMSYVALRRQPDQAPEGSPEIRAQLASMSKQTSTEPIQVEPELRSLRTDLAPSPQPARVQAPGIKEAAANSPPIRPDDPEPFANAGRAMEDPYFNPLRKRLTTEQRHELQALIDGANKRARELQTVIEIQTEEHARQMISHGEGTPLPPGQKARRTSPGHDTLSVINDGAGAMVVSFARREVTEIADSINGRDEFIQSTADMIKKYFGEH